MHKYDYYIQDYLLNEGKFSAEHIGEFNVVKGEGSASPVINFTYDKHAGTTQELVTYVAEREHKSKIVIGFDLEAHFDEARQFINTGKPWVIPGIGQVQMNTTSREYELVPAQEEIAAAQERKRAIQNVQPSHEYGLERSEGVGNNRAGIILLSLLVIAALGFGAYYLYSHQQEAEPDAAVTDTVTTGTDTMVSVPPSSNMNNTVTATQPPAATPVQQPATANPIPATNSNGTLNVQYVITKTFNTAYAYKRYKQLKAYGIGVNMDSTRNANGTLYKLYLTKSLPPSDTARVKDSLSVYFGKPVRIEGVK